MPISAGTRLGSYELVAQIGAGGMGEVYQAHDTKLGRDVAIKVLPEAVADDAERLARFQREAKMLASLNHPNIATIHGLAQSNGTNYLVMELVAGETLADRIKRERAIPIEEALKIAVQIAEALEAAHEKGIIHRDLKPANVKVTPEGKVKVLDFGLAKAFAGDGASGDPGNSPTMSMAATMHGVILGTAAYMSPEQARGKAVDKRTDLWAFGCVLYEMLTGRQAFQGEDITDILGAVVRAEPGWNRLPENTPLSIRTLLRRCLQKDKILRFRDAGDARIEIQEALNAPLASGPSIAVVPRSTALRWALFSGVVCLIVAVMVGVAVWNLKLAPATSPRPVSRLTIALPPGQRLALQTYISPVLALSPDGSLLAYIAISGGTQQIYLRPLDSLEARPLPGTEGADSAFFSPDGQWLGFFAEGKLKKVSANGGAVVTLANATFGRGASWGSQGTIIFAPGINSVVQQVSDAGGTAQPLTRFDKGEFSHRWPEFLPDGKRVLFAGGPTYGNWTNAQVLVQSSTGERRRLIEGGTDPRYALTGHLLYVQAGTLMAAPFDSQRLELTGKAVPVVENIIQSPLSGAAQYSISDTGSLAYVGGGVQEGQQRLVWVSRNGAEQSLAAPPHGYLNPQLSPDGRRAAVVIYGQEQQIWLYDLTRDTLTRFTFDGTSKESLVWTADGKRIVFGSYREGTFNLYWQLADGGGGLERLTSSDYLRDAYSSSSDGHLLAFVELNPATGYDIWVLRLVDRKAQPFLRTPFNESMARFSPDGRWLAYVSDESGREEVYVQPYPGPGGKWQVSADGGTEPVWNPKGRELFYRNGGKLMAVDVVTQPSFSAGKPRMLFQGSYIRSLNAGLSSYDVSPDGQRFLMLKTSEQPQFTSQINIVLNWFEELKRRVPTGK